MYGVILGQDIPFPGGCPVTDACANLASGDCPIEAGEEFVWNMEMPIESWFPGVSCILLSWSNLSTIPTLNSYFNSLLNSHFLLSKSGNTFLRNGNFSKKNPIFY